MIWMSLIKFELDKYFLLCNSALLEFWLSLLHLIGFINIALFSIGSSFT